MYLLIEVKNGRVREEEDGMMAVLLVESGEYRPPTPREQEHYTREKRRKSLLCE